MRSVFASVFLITAPAALACPPPSQDPHSVAERERKERKWFESASDIVYAVVTRTIHETYEPDAKGTIRILHSYRGATKKDDRVNVRYAVPTYCPMPLRSEQKGSYGVTLLHRQSDGTIWYGGFLAPQTVQYLIDNGTIRSARAAPLSSK